MEGVGTVVIEDLHPKPMTAKGGRRKKAMNREMRYGRVGALLARIRLTAENAGVRVSQGRSARHQHYMRGMRPR